MKSRRLARVRPAAHWLLVLVVVGYPAAGLMASAFNWDSLVASLPLRAGVLALSLWVLLSTRRGPRPRHGWILGGFGALYLLRLVWDAGVAGVPGAREALVFYMLIVLVPCLALWARSTELDQVSAARWMLRAGSLICFTAVTMHSLGIGQDRALTEDIGRLSFEALNPISIGHAAVSTLVAALCMTQTRLRGFDLLLLLAGSLAALVALGLAASRGPVLCLTAVALVYALATQRWRWLILLAIAAVGLLANPETALWERFAGVEEDESSLERLVLQGSALTAFLTSPLWGSAFVEPLLLTYPHNLFIEAAMALGVIGLVLLLVLLCRSAQPALQQLRLRRLLLPLLSLQYFIAAQLSGSIYGNSALWACVALLVGSAVAPRRRRIRATPAAAPGVIELSASPVQ